MFGRKKIKELESEVGLLKSQLKWKDKETKENYQLKCENNELSSKLKKTATKVRTQTKSDLYYECMTIMKELENGKKKEDVQPNRDSIIALQSNYQSQLQDSNNPSNLRGEMLGGVMGGYYGV